MLLSLSILGLFLSVILLIFNARKNTSTIYLGIFFLLVSLYGLYQYILLYSKSINLISLFLLNFAILIPPLFLIGPMLFWYVRSVLTDNFRLKKGDLWHLLPMIIYLLAAIPYTFIPWSEKVEAATEAVKDVAYIQTYKATILEEIFAVSAIYLSRPILVLIYTLWSIVLLVRYSMQWKVSRVFARQYFMTKWLCLFLLFILILVVTHVLLIIRVFAMDFSELFFTLNLLRILSIVGLIGLLISPFFFPEILYGLPRFPESDRSLTAKNEERMLLNDEGKNHQFHLESNYLVSINQKAEFCMKEHQPYLQPDCNLAYFSKLTDIPTHHLAYYFRKVKKQHFNDFRNEWRINHAKALIQEGKANQVTLEAIGTLSGFSSRNAFISDFKKFEGVSPGTYAARFN